MKRTQAIWAIAALSVALSTACAASFRTVGMEDPSVEIVRALSATQASTIKALTDALTVAQKLACEVK
jgi:hypothetical protein